MLTQLLKERKDLTEKVSQEIERLNESLKRSQFNEFFQVGFRVQGQRLLMKPMSQTVGEAQNQRYVYFGWTEYKGEWCLTYKDTVSSIHKEKPLQGADCFYQNSFAERQQIFLSEMEKWLFESNILIEKNLGVENGK